jgi:mutator protein MutT
MKDAFRLGVYGIAEQNGKILLVKKQSGPFTGKWDLPGGGNEFGEHIEETLRREFVEEVAMTFRHMVLFDNYSYAAEVMQNQKPFMFHHIGLIYTVLGFQILEDAKGSEEAHWFLIKDLDIHTLTPFASYVVKHKLK